MQGFDILDVSAWLCTNVADVESPFTVELVAGGRSNLTFKVTDARGRSLIVRRPPLGDLADTAHDVAREFRIINALGRSGVPVPAVYGLCIDDQVNGAPFSVMEFSPGFVLDSAVRAELLPPELRTEASNNLIDVLGDLHDLDVDAVGLGDLSRREGHVERQIRRWSTQWTNIGSRDVPVVDEVGRRLMERIPTQQRLSIVHGDYRFGNCLIDIENGRVTAVLDWELCTLGDPLADLGHLGVYWNDGRSHPVRSNDPTPAGGFPVYPDLLERYAMRTGRDLADIAYYDALACWRLAIISEGISVRYRAGSIGDQGLDLLEISRSVEELADRALAAVNAR